MRAPASLLNELLRLPAASAATPAAPAPAILARLRFINRQGPTAHHRAVKRFDRGIGLGIRRHLHETESLRLTRVLVGNDRYRGHGAGGCEQGLQLLLRGGIG